MNRERRREEREREREGGRQKNVGNDKLLAVWAQMDL